MGCEVSKKFMKSFKVFDQVVWCVTCIDFSIFCFGFIFESVKSELIWQF